MPDQIELSEGKIALLINFPTRIRKQLKAMAAYHKTSETAMTIKAVENEWQRFVRMIDSEMAIESTEEDKEYDPIVKE